MYKQYKTSVLLILKICLVVVLNNLSASGFNREEEGEHDEIKIWYFSTRVQLEEMMECLDKKCWEMDLCATLEEMKEEIQAHMAITEDLTNKARGISKPYLTALNGTYLFFFH